MSSDDKWEAWINKYTGEAVAARRQYIFSCPVYYKLITPDSRVVELPEDAFEALYRKATAEDEWRRA
jgi:hypothetical protein